MLTGSSTISCLDSSSNLAIELEHLYMRKRRTWRMRHKVSFSDLQYCVNFLHYWSSWRGVVLTAASKSLEGRSCGILVDYMRLRSTLVS